MRNRMCLAWLCLITSAAPLAACSGDAAISVVQQGDTISFHADRDGDTCVENVEVYPAENGGPDPIWYVTTANPELCVDRFVYGKPPAGFSQGSAAPALANGVTYRVFASGKGFMGVRFFTPRADGGEIGREAP